VRRRKRPSTRSRPGCCFHMILFSITSILHFHEFSAHKTRDQLRNCPKSILPSPSDISPKMLKYRSRIRIFLFTFLVGVFLTSAYARLNAYIDAMTAEIPTVNVDELRINLPVIRSDSPLIVRPQTDKFPIVYGGGGAGGGASTSATGRFILSP